MSVAQCAACPSTAHVCRRIEERKKLLEPQVLRIADDDDLLENDLEVDDSEDDNDYAKATNHFHQGSPVHFVSLTLTSRPIRRDDRLSIEPTQFRLRRIIPFRRATMAIVTDVYPQLRQIRKPTDYR